MEIFQEKLVSLYTRIDRMSEQYFKRCYQENREDPDGFVECMYNGQKHFVALSDGLDKNKMFVLGRLMDAGEKNRDQDEELNELAPEVLSSLNKLEQNL